MKHCIIIFFFSITVLGCNSNNKSQEQQNLIRTSKQWSDAASNRDVDKTLSYWADDAVVMAAGQPVLTGKAEIKKMIEANFNNPSFRISWSPKTADIEGNMGYLIEDTKVTTDDSLGKPITQRFKTVTIWKKQTDGQWKNVVDIMTPKPFGVK